MICFKEVKNLGEEKEEGVHVRCGDFSYVRKIKKKEKAVEEKKGE